MTGPRPVLPGDFQKARQATGLASRRTQGHPNFFLAAKIGSSRCSTLRLGSSAEALSSTTMFPLVLTGYGLAVGFRRPLGAGPLEFFFPRRAADGNPARRTLSWEAFEPAFATNLPDRPADLQILITPPAIARPAADFREGRPEQYSRTNSAKDNKTRLSCLHARTHRQQVGRPVPRPPSNRCAQSRHQGHRAARVELRSCGDRARAL